MVRVIHLSDDAWTGIVAHAQADAPLECCGLLVGRGDTVVRAVPARNLDASRVRYTLDPRAYLAAARDARTAGLDVVGAYHSHPGAAPVPSATDLAEGVDAPFVYLIAGPVDGRRVPELRAWERRAGAFAELVLLRTAAPPA
jgi:proteasome lid subunit RPN8/RPN11